MNKKEEEFCEHMQSLVNYCRENKVYFGGCGECGSAWLECDLCNETVENAHQAFDNFYGGYK